jgi:hypothetical protein
MGNHEKIMENWENHGEIMAKSWEMATIQF